MIKLQHCCHMQSQKLSHKIDISHYMIDQDTLNLVIPGDLITSEEGFINGHGTYRDGGKIYASVIGTVQTTNKLIMVNPLRNKYVPQIGDIVVGRVQQISNKRWKVDIKSSAYATLSLNSTYIPEQRKKNEEDQFNMRKIMQEGDLIVAEVHSVNNDKSYNLHTRNPKYGRLEPGTLVQASHRQIKRQKHHMVSIGKVGVIIGNNGNLYLSNFRRNQATNLKQAVIVHKKYTTEQMEDVTIVGNLIKILSFEGLEISQMLLKELFEWVNESGIDTFSILNSSGQVKEELFSRVRERIPKRIEDISLSLKKN